MIGGVGPIEIAAIVAEEYEKRVHEIMSVEADASKKLAAAWPLRQEAIVWKNVAKRLQEMETSHE